MRTASLALAILLVSLGSHTVAHVLYFPYTAASIHMLQGLHITLITKSKYPLVALVVTGVYGRKMSFPPIFALHRCPIVPHHPDEPLIALESEPILSERSQTCTPNTAISCHVHKNTPLESRHRWATPQAVIMQKEKGWGPQRNSTHFSCTW